jgi:hypothetical protein
MLRNALFYGTVAAAFAVSMVVADAFAGAPDVNSEPRPITRLEDARALEFHSVHSDHFHLLIDAAAVHPDADAISRLLETTHNEFFTAFPADRFSVSPLRDSPTWVCFEAPDQFARYAQLADRRDMSHLRGYYSARTNRVALLMDDQSIAPTARSSRMTSTGENDVASAPLQPRRIDRRISHEAVHQLAFNSGLYRRGVMYPLWAGEGLATNFERITHDPLGPAYDNPDRRVRLLEASRGNRLVPLRQFATLVRLPHDPADVADHYAQAWGLFRYLYLHRGDQLVAYLAAAARCEPGWRDPQNLLDAFTDAFGPIGPLNDEFVAWVNELPVAN